MDQTEINIGPSCHGGGAEQNIKESVVNINIQINVDQGTSEDAVRNSIIGALRSLGLGGSKRHDAITVNARGIR